MSRVTTNDGARIFYKDWGSGDPIVFSHGWPLSADAWDNQMMFFLEKGFRVVAHDRRGHGRSTPTWNNNTMDQYADDLAAVIEHLDLKNITLVGHSTGGGEVARYIGRHGTKRVARIVLLGAVPPLMLQTENNPAGAPLAVFDEIRAGMLRDRGQYFRDFSIPFYGFNRTDAKVSEGMRELFWFQAMMGCHKAQYDCVEQFSESDFHDDLKKFDVPTLIIHGDDDQIVPIKSSALLTAKIVPDARLKIYRGAPHGLAQTQADEFNGELLSFIRETGEMRSAA